MNGYEKHVFVCENLRSSDSGKNSCGRAHSAEMRQWLKKQVVARGLKGKVRINSSGCLGFCHLGPVMVIYPQGIWYAGFTADDLEEILTESILSDRVIHRLKLTQPQNEKIKSI